jgi:FkbM family methyltransferase
MESLKNSDMKKLVSKILRRVLREPSPNVLDDYLPKTDAIVLVDVGAHNGGFTAAMCQQWNVVRAILVEPLAEQAEMLRTKFAAQGFEIVNAAASSEVGTTMLNAYGFAETSSILPIKQGLTELEGFDTTSRGTVPCPMVTLDSITEKVERVDLLKIDVQGAEHLALAGATSLMKKTRLIWIEVSFKPLYEGSSVFHEIYAMIDAAGFRLVSLSPGFRSADGELVQADALFQQR